MFHDDVTSPHNAAQKNLESRIKSDSFSSLKVAPASLIPMQMAQQLFNRFRDKIYSHEDTNDLLLALYDLRCLIKLEPSIVKLATEEDLDFIYQITCDQGCNQLSSLAMDFFISCIDIDIEIFQNLMEKGFLKIVIGKLPDIIAINAIDAILSKFDEVPEEFNDFHLVSVIFSLFLASTIPAHYMFQLFRILKYFHKDLKGPTYNVMIWSNFFEVFHKLFEKIDLDEVIPFLDFLINIDSSELGIIYNVLLQKEFDVFLENLLVRMPSKYLFIQKKVLSLLNQIAKSSDVNARSLIENGICNFLMDILKSLNYENIHEEISQIMISIVSSSSDNAIFIILYQNMINEINLSFFQGSYILQKFAINFVLALMKWTDPKILRSVLCTTIFDVISNALESDDYKLITNILLTLKLNWDKALNYSNSPCPKYYQKVLELLESEQIHEALLELIDCEDENVVELAEDALRIQKENLLFEDDL